MDAYVVPISAEPLPPPTPTETLVSKLKALSDSIDCERELIVNHRNIIIELENKKTCHEKQRNNVIRQLLELHPDRCPTCGLHLTHTKEFPCRKNFAYWNWVPGEFAMNAIKSITACPYPHICKVIRKNNSSNNGAGVSIEFIQHALQYTHTSEDIKEAMDFLFRETHICTTIDNNHFHGICQIWEK